MQDAVKPGQNIIGIDFEVTKQQFLFVSILTWFALHQCSQLQITPARKLLSIPIQSTVILTSTLPSDALSVRHNQILVGIGHLLLFQVEYGKTSGSYTKLTGRKLITLHTYYSPYFHALYIA